MELFNDSRACLCVAEEMLKEIDVMMQTSLKEEHLIPYIKVKIKNCLENFRSPLDYIAVYIFECYCGMEYTPKEFKKYSKAYYPSFYSKNMNNLELENLFNVRIKEYYKSLVTKRPDITKVFENSQSFKGDNWLRNLNELINENKHRNLTQQTKEQTVHINSFRIGLNNFTNFTFVNSETPITIDDTPIDFMSPSPFDHLFDGTTVSIEYFFEALKLPVIPTLISIYSGTKKVIDEIEKIL